MPIQRGFPTVLGARVASETLSGANGNTVFQLPHDRLVEVLKMYNKYDAEAAARYRESVNEN